MPADWNRSRAVPALSRKHRITSRLPPSLWLLAGLLCAAPGHAAATGAMAAVQPATAEVDPESSLLTAQIGALQTLLDNRLPEQITLDSLFDIDLRDETAVQARVQTLTSALAQPQTQADAGEDSALQRLRDTRDRLRLTFLSRPAEQRSLLLQQERLRQASLSLRQEEAEQTAVLSHSDQARNDIQAQAGAGSPLAEVESALLARLSAQASLRQQAAEQLQQSVEARRTLLARYVDISTSRPLPPDIAYDRYLQIRDDLARLRQDAARDLSSLGAASTLAGLGPVPALPSASGASERAALPRLIALQDRIRHEEARWQDAERQARYLRAADTMDALRTLQSLRIILRGQLAPARRAEVSGFNRAGLTRIGDEIAHIRLMARWYPINRLHDLRAAASESRDFFAASRLGLITLEVLTVLATLLYVRSRSRIWLTRLRGWLLPQIRQAGWRARADRILRMSTAISRELTVLLMVYACFDWLLAGSTSHLAEMAAARRLAYAYAFYALFLAITHRILLTAISRHRVVSNALNDKILWSLRLVARLVLMVAVYLILARALLGEGALSDIARDLALLGSLLVTWRLISAWRDEVISTYLSLSPEGSLASLVQARKEQHLGLMLVFLAFIHVAAISLWRWLRDRVLGLEQTRKALAYLFRRQLERQAPADRPAPAPLPDDLQAALSEEPADELWRIDHFPHLEQTLALASARQGGLLALVGDRGAGKTTWLRTLHERLPSALPCQLISLDERVIRPQQARCALCRQLDLPEDLDAREMVEQLLTGEPRVILLDLAQNLMLRAPGGLDGFEHVLDLAQRTRSRVLWIMAFAAWPYAYIERVLTRSDNFDQVLQLSPWSERRIAALIEGRMRSAGYTAVYDQLITNEHNTYLPPAELDEASDRIADRYHRLIWDYADGNPRLALHFFRLSLSWRSGRHVQVRLFPMPAGNALDAQATDTHFVLSCLVQHENLTAAEAAASLGLPATACARALDLLQGHGYLTCEHGRYRVSSHWNRAVLRFLQRRKLLPA
ncbi:MAG: AAA family ATPase [Perlucidibaca sp.]